MFKRKEWMSQETGEIVVGWWGKLFATWENRTCYGIKDSKWKLYKRGQEIPPNKKERGNENEH